MNLVIISSIAVFAAILFLVLWIRERRRASNAEVVAYGLRAQDDADENTKTSISILESEYDAAIRKLSDMGEIRKDEWGRWVWSKTGELLGTEE
jgi:uncharacterized membrane protein